MTILKLYLDESGHSRSHPYVAVAGYLAPAERWTKFEDEWDEALRAAGVVNNDGTVVPFHMTDFEARRRTFKSWDRARRERLLSALFGVIERHQLYAVGYVVSVEWWNSFDWNRFTPEHVPLEDPYHHAVQGVVQATLNLIAEPLAPDLHDANEIICTFSRQTEYGGRAKAYLTSLAEHLSSPERRIVIEFEATGRMASLQAADIVAFELRWRATRPHIDRWPMRQVLQSRRAMFGAVPPERFEAAVQSLGGETREMTYADRVLRVRPEVLKKSRRRVTPAE